MSIKMKSYTLTVREVLDNLGTLADAYEKVASGTSPTGNYFFAVNAADTAASLKAAQQLILHAPVWIPLDAHPRYGTRVLLTDGRDITTAEYTEEDGWSIDFVSMDFGPPKAWMPLPEVTDA